MNKQFFCEYEQNGYLVLPSFYSAEELKVLREVIEKFHKGWMQDNEAFYQSRAINSACLTDNQYLNEAEREVIFQFIASTRLMNVAELLLPGGVGFMNTQLFFDPANKGQNNYWHRDPQYHLSLEEQQAALNGPEVLHFRVPLFDEPGLELVPGTHTRWDSEEELAVRLEQDEHNNHEDLSSGVKIPLRAGDLLVFSGLMIHRGLYGKNRMAFDILLCDPEPELLQFVKPSCLPDSDVLAKLENGNVFKTTMAILDAQ